MDHSVRKMPANNMKLKWLIVFVCSLMLCISVLDAAAQQRKNFLPRVGTIKDYPATGLMTGCGNLYFYPATNPNTSAADYVFLASGDGSNAWMNLNGRDVRLQRIKLSRSKRNRSSYEYRLGTLRVSVMFEDFKPASQPVEEDDPMLKMRITLRRGRTVRIVRAVGGSDC